MQILNKLKQFFDNIFSKREVALLDSNSINQSNNKNLQYDENNFIYSLKHFEFDWQKPNPDLPITIIYKDLDLSYLPISLIDNNSILTPDNFNYNGKNKYTFKSEKLSPEDQYNIAKELASFASDTIGMNTIDTPYQEEFLQMSHSIRSSFNISSYLYNKGIFDDAIKNLDSILKNITNFRNKILEKESQNNNKNINNSEIDQK